MPPLRSDTTFLVLLVAILLAALAVTGMEMPDAPHFAQITPRPLPPPTGTPTSGWWGEVAFATPTLPALPGVPNVQLGGGFVAAIGNLIASSLANCQLLTANSLFLANRHLPSATSG